MRRSRHLKKQNKRWPLLLGFFLFLIFTTLAYTFFKVSTLEKFIYLNKAANGDAEIIIIDTKNNNVIKYLISGDIELEAAHGYGKYKLVNLWTLSKKFESRGGLVSDTFVSNYFLPIYLWKDGNSSNLSFTQKIKAKITEKSTVFNSEKIEPIKIPKSVYINFIDQYLSENLNSVEVQDLTDDNHTIKKVSSVLEVLGGKITANSNGYDKDLDCKISGVNKLVIASINNILKCEVVAHENKSVDLTIKLGVKFAERF